MSTFLQGHGRRLPGLHQSQQSFIRLGFFFQQRAELLIIRSRLLDLGLQLRQLRLLLGDLPL